MRKLTAIENNSFTPQVYDIIVPDNFDAEDDDGESHIFIVMEHAYSDM